MSRSKFICGEDAAGLEVAIVFPEYINHNQMALDTRLKVVSAGFVAFGVTKDFQIEVKPYGESTSLKIGIPEEHKKLTIRCLQYTLGLVD